MGSRKEDSERLPVLEDELKFVCYSIPLGERMERGDITSHAIGEWDRCQTQVTVTLVPKLKLCIRRAGAASRPKAFYF